MTSKRVEPAIANKKALSIEEALQVVPVGRTALYAALKDGRLVAKKFGRRTIILVEDLDRFLSQLPVVNHSGD
jgi:excisionase family DNA binding protein